MAAQTSQFNKLECHVEVICETLEITDWVYEHLGNTTLATYRLRF